MSLGDVIASVTAALDSAGIAYMLTGSMASAYHGVARATQDVDVVVHPTEDQLRSFVAQLPKDRYYVDLDMALEARRREGMFNVIDVTSGWKVDLIMRKSRPFSRAEFERRRSVDLVGSRVFIATAEDVVVAKLEWAKKSQSARQIEDVAGILRIRSDLDRPYLGRWIGELHLEAQWRAACELAGVTPS